MGRVAAADHERYARARREAILNAALKVFAQNGFPEARMEEVAGAAGLSKAALYLYFPSKDALLRSLLKRYALLPELPAMVAALGDAPPAAGIPILIAQIWRRLCERKDLARVIVQEIQSKPERARLLAEQVGLPNAQSLAAYLERWMRCGALRHQNSLAVAQCLFGMLWFFFLTQELAGGRELHPLSDKTVVDTVTQMFLEGAAKPVSRAVTARRADGGRLRQKH